MTVKVVKPITITEAVLTASSIPEPDASVGEVEFVPDRRKVMDVDFLGNTVASNDYDRAHFLPTNLYGFDHGSVYFEKVFYPDDTTTIEMLKCNVTYGTQGFQCYYDSITSCDVSSFIDASDTRFLGCAVERYSQSNTVGRSCFFVANDVSEDISAIFADNFTLAQSSLRLAMPQVAVSLNNTDTYTIFIIDGEFYGFFRVVSSGRYYFQKWDSLGQLVESADVAQVVSSSYAMLYLDGKYRSYRGYATSSQDFYYSSDNNFATATTIKMPQAYEANVRTAFTDGDNIFISYSDNSRIEIFTADTGASLGYYQPNERAILTSTHKLYQCVKATNIRPEIGATGDETETWVEVGATNKFASFDDRLSYPAKITGTQSFELTLADRVNTVAFLNISGITSVRVQMDVGGSIVYDATKEGLDTSLIYDHYTWWFSDAEYVTELIFDDLPPYPNSKLIIDVTGDGELGQIVTGFAKVIGECLAESNSNSIDLSTQEFDAFGKPKYVSRPIIKLNKYEILSDKSIAPAVERLFRELSGKNALWIGEIGSGQLLTTYGYTERSPIPYNMPTAINYSATIRGSA